MDGNEIYQKAKELKNTDKNRWEDGVDHHYNSMIIMEFLSAHDFNDCNDYFCWKFGGDGDNGESLMYQLDAFFETLDTLGKKL